MRLSVLGVGSKNSPKTRKNTPKWVKISIFFPKSPQNPPENGFGGGSGQFSALISGKTSKIVVKFRGGGVLRIDPYGKTVNYTSRSFKSQRLLDVLMVPVARSEDFVKVCESPVRFYVFIFIFSPRLLL